MRGMLYVADLYGCATIPEGIELAELVREAVKEAGMAAVPPVYDGRPLLPLIFPEEVYGEDYGESAVTVIVPIVESHVAIHTFPAQKFVAVDFFTCGDPEKARHAVDWLINVLQPEWKRVTVLRRGED